MMKITEEKLLLEKDVREELITCVEVLETVKVKDLLLLPDIGMATTQQVADFYEVGVEVIKKIIQRNGDELRSDGYRMLTGLDVKNLVREKMSLTKIISKHGYFLVETDNGTVKMANRRNGLFPKRAILRVGMLLRDSKVAKEVRNQLLTIERKTPNTIKAAEMNHELSSFGTEMGKAFTQMFTNAMSSIDAYIKQNNEKLEKKVKSIEEELKAITIARDATLDDYVITSTIADRFTKDGAAVKTAEILDILVRAGFIRRVKNGILPTYLGQKNGAKTHVKYNNGYNYSYVMWTNRTIENVFYPLFKKHGLELKYSN